MLIQRDALWEIQDNLIKLFVCVSDSNLELSQQIKKTKHMQNILTRNEYNEIEIIGAPLNDLMHFTKQLRKHKLI